jgi:serine/threonine-protein phosphatase 4 regulatory subunit 4
MFVEICKMIFELYSKSFFKNWFYEHLINLSNDEVTNVKLAFIKILPKLKKLWNMYDREKLDVIEKILANLLHDKDKDVIELTEKVIFLTH